MFVSIDDNNLIVFFLAQISGNRSIFLVGFKKLCQKTIESKV